MDTKYAPRKTPELVAEAKRLLDTDLSKREVVRRLGIPKTTLALWLAPVDAAGRTRKNRTRQDLRNRKYHSDPLYRIKQLLRVARTKAEREGYLPCSTPAEEILATITTKCQCCNREESECGVLCLDHWHTHPGTFRAWLCHDCNRGIGLLQDDVTILRRAIAILEQKDAAAEIQRRD